MFFAPPKVKSLSQYSEFGVYFGHKYFIIMVGIAALVHIAVIVIYSMVPTQEVIRIPVRVLNIKLGGGVGIAMPVKISQAPAAGSGATVKADATKPAPLEWHNHTHAARARNAANKSAVYQAAKTREDAEEDKSQKASAENNLDTPKQYVRETDMANGAGGNGQGTGTGAGSGTGTGSEAGGGGGGTSEQIRQRYEQTISWWISQHKIYPEDAKKQGIEGDAVVRLRINRDGHIIFSTIERSSGNAIIDEAVTAMVRASEPAPRIPDNYPDGNEVEYLIPVSFHLQ